MALFTDGEVSGIEDLRGYDTQLLDVANVEGIDVTRKLQLAQQEMAVEVTALLGRLRLPGRLNAEADLGRVVVTPPLKLWHTYLALELVYRDAYGSQLNDRYAGKRDEYHGLVKWAYGKVIQTGLGIANDPVVQAPPPRLQAAVGGLADGTYYVAASWTNGAGVEGAVSTPVTIEITGSSFSASAGAAPANAKGWNVYAGMTPAALTLQNDAALGMGQTWAQADAISTNGRTAETDRGPTT